jgi:hypothetical protein
MRGNEYKKNLGSNRIVGNNEREPENQIDPKIIDSANEILQHQEKLKTRLREKYRKANMAQLKPSDD